MIYLTFQIKHSRKPLLQTVVNGCFYFRNVKIYKIIKIFCFFLW